MHFTHYNDDCYIEYVTRVNGPDDKWHDTLLCKRSAKGGSPEDPMGGHMNTPHTSPDMDVEGQAEDGELSRREGQEIEGKEG